MLTILADGKKRNLLIFLCILSGLKIAFEFWHRKRPEK